MDDIRNFMDMAIYNASNLPLENKFHFVSAVILWISVIYQWFILDIPPEIDPVFYAFPISGRFKFLAFWVTLIQATFFTICCMNDIFGMNDIYPRYKPTIRKVKDRLFTCLAFPLSMFMVSMFWCLYWIDRNLIYPEYFEAYIPGWLNHLMHTYIAVFVVVQMYIEQRKYPPRKKGLTIIVTFICSYIAWLHIIYIFYGVWVYPILQVLCFPLRIIFFAMVVALNMAFYIVGENLDYFFWRRYRLNHSRTTMYIPTDDYESEDVEVEDVEVENDL